MQNFVKIVSVSEERKDKNNRTFKLITVSSDTRKEVTDPSTGEVFFAVGKPKKTTIVSYQKSYLDDAPHYLYDLPVNTIVNGNIVTRTVEPYTIETQDGPKELTRYTTFVEADVEDIDFEEIVNRAFENSGRKIALAPIKSVTETTKVEEVTNKVPVMSADDAFNGDADNSEESDNEESDENTLQLADAEDEESFEGEF